uniref:Elongation of very long chain fatty acids protein n=1 Tax=Nerita melanotragus TaxID=464123 RepID=A0A0M5J7Z2_9GAST|nr:elongation of very long-chain fatty acid protein b [Nerita melanotragus]
MMQVMQSVFEYYDWIMSERDPRSTSWFLMDSPWTTVAIVALYLAFVVAGPRYMADKKPFALKEVLVVYNFALVCLSAYMFYEFLVTSWLKPGFNLVCSSMDYSNDRDAVRLAKVCWWFYFSKIIELLDTVFFVLRKKNNQISFLHVYHHSTMPLLWWVGVSFVPGGEAYLSASINCFIHTVMYLYYLLAAMGPHMQKYLWWKRYMTTLQLLQFWAILLHTGYAVTVTGSDWCTFPVGYGYALILYDLSHLALFSNFYYQTYVKKGRRQPSAETNHVTEVDGSVRAPRKVQKAD